MLWSIKGHHWEVTLVKCRRSHQKVVCTRRQQVLIMVMYVVTKGSKGRWVGSLASCSSRLTEWVDFCFWSGLVFFLVVASKQVQYRLSSVSSVAAVCFLPCIWTLRVITVTWLQTKRNALSHVAQLAEVNLSGSECSHSLNMTDRRSELLRFLRDLPVSSNYLLHILDSQMRVYLVIHRRGEKDIFPKMLKWSLLLWSEVNDVIFHFKNASEWVDHSWKSPFHSGLTMSCSS